MSQLVEMPFRCGDGEALMTYAYGESSRAERDAIAAHVARCVACAEELAAIGSTREQLAAWTPPAQTLGFQLTRAEDRADAVSELAAPATVLRPAAWWNRPLPAWAQMAAAVVIFASGLAIGLSRSTPPGATLVREVPAAGAVPAAAAQPVVSRQELARVEQRLMGEIAQMRTVAPAGAEPTAAMMQRVSQMITASERRQQQELDFRTSQIVTDFSDRRKIDMMNIENRLGRTANKVRDNQQDINLLGQRIGYTPAYSQYIP